MLEVVALAVVAVLVGVAIVGSRRWRSHEHAELIDELDDQLATALPAGRTSHLERSPTVRRLEVDDEQLIPVVRIDLGMADTPSTTFALEFAADALEAIHPVVCERGLEVSQYELEFAFGPSGLFVGGECRRVTIPAAMVDRLCEDDRYRAFDLHRAVKRADGDPASPTALWVEC